MRRLAVVALLAAGCGNGGFSVSSVAPAIASSLAPTPITIHGSGFSGLVSTSIDDTRAPTVDAQFGVRIGSTTLPPATVRRIDDRTLAATVPQGLAPSQYDVVVIAPGGAEARLAHGLRVVPPPALTATAAFDPSAIAVGQDFALVVTVDNGGGDPALSVTAGTPGSVGGAAVTLLDSPAPVDIAPGASAALAFHYRADFPGDVTFTTAASGTASGGGTVVSNLVTAKTTISTAPILDGSAAITPSPATVGQSFTVTLTITNSGQSTASAVTPAAPMLSGDGAATLVSSPAPADIAPGAQATFSWTYTAAQAGTLSLALDAAGTDPAGNAVTMPTVDAGPLTIVPAPAMLDAVVAVLPARVAVGQVFEVDVTVHNGGGTAALGVTVATPAASGSGTATLSTSPSANDIPAGESRTFTFVFSATGAGSIVFTASASGSDAMSGTTVATGPVMSSPLVIDTPAALTLVLGALPATALEGTLIAVSATVSDGGQAGARAVVPTLTLSGSGSATLVSGPTPAQADIAGGGMQTFTWQYRAATPGTVTFTAGAGGSDADSGAPVSAATQQGSVTVVKHAALSASFTVPTSVSPSQTFTVTMTVQNTGGNDAIAIAPTALTLGGTATATLVSGPTPSSFAGPLAPGNTTQFQWSYSAGAVPGTLTFTGGATGQDKTDSASISAPAVTSSAVTVGNPAALTATLAIPSAITRGQTFTVTLTVDDVGGDAANGVTPAALVAQGSAAVTLVSGPQPPSANISAGGNASFTWTFIASSDGTLQFSGGASGSDAATLQPVSVSVTSNSATVEDVELLATNPFGDGTAFSFVFAYDGYVYLGPRGNGTGAVRMKPDGSSPQSVSWSIGRDASVGASMQNTSTPPYPSLGYSGCSINTSQCGPNDENGRGMFGAGTIAGTPWMIAGGSRSAGGDAYLYMTSDTGTAVTLSWIDVSQEIESSTRALAAVHVFADRVYAGFANPGGQRPVLARLDTLPTAPGLNASATDFVNLRADQMAGMKASNLALIDAIGDFGGKLYIGNDGAWYRADATPAPVYDGANWSAVTPSSSDYGAKTSLTTSRQSDYTPADLALPAFAAFNGRLYAARNTTTGPQLWMCDPTRTGAAGDCDAGDWTLLARNTLGDTQLSQFDDAGNTRVTLLVATAGHLYVGYDNGSGIELWRSTVAQPAQQSDFEGQNGCAANLHATGCAPLGGMGAGDASNDTHIFAGVAATFAGADDVYVVTGNGSNAVRVLRLAE